jgi:DivIVA domain-containing protein
MPLIPAEVHNVAFSKPPLGKRGYDEDEVDAFLDLVEAELMRLIEENNHLRDQVEQLDAQRHAASVGTGADLCPVEAPGPMMGPMPPPVREQPSPGDDHNVHAVQVLGLAQEMAERVTGTANAEADAMVSAARTTSEQLLAEARAKAEGMVTEARTRAESLLNDARTKAESLERASREKAASLEREATRQHTEIITALNQDKSILEKIDELRTFECDYRTRLKTYLTSQLRDLDGCGSVAPADPMRTQHDLVAAGFGGPAQTRDYAR